MRRIREARRPHIMGARARGHKDILLVRRRDIHLGRLRAFLLDHLMGNRQGISSLLQDTGSLPPDTLRKDISNPRLVTSSRRLDIPLMATTSHLQGILLTGTSSPLTGINPPRATIRPSSRNMGAPHRRGSTLVSIRPSRRITTTLTIGEVRNTPDRIRT